MGGIESAAASKVPARRATMQSLALLWVLSIVTACSPGLTTTPDMIEVTVGNSPAERMQIAATIMVTLSNEGLPDMSCTGAAEHSPECKDAITPYELTVDVVHSEDMSRVYLQCHVRDGSAHPGLLGTCLGRVRQELAR